jgi:hypothetical protein
MAKCSEFRLVAFAEHGGDGGVGVTMIGEVSIMVEQVLVVSAGSSPLCLCCIAGGLELSAATMRSAMPEIEL